MADNHAPLAHVRKSGSDGFTDTAYGFYWTEGLTGVGWAKDAVPTLKAAAHWVSPTLLQCGCGRPTPGGRSSHP